jgi:ABC-type transport system substrate-binding protein
MKTLLALLSLVIAVNVYAAKKGGNFYINISQEPTTLNPLTATDAYSSQVHSLTLEGLLDRNLDTFEWEPALAEKWEISKDKLTFTFYLRKGVKWHDGKPFTAEDVKYSFDALRSGKWNTAHLKPYLEGIESCTVVDSHTVKFKAKKRLYANFDYVASGIIDIVPKHIYQPVEGNKKKQKRLNKKIIGTGPYKLGKLEKGKKITLVKNKNWWGKDVYKKRYKFNKVVMRFVKESNIALEMLKKGKIDYEGLDAESYMKKAKGKAWGKSVFKIKTNNKAPKGYNFIGWNLTNPILKDKQVRIALSHLVNRKLMNEKFKYNMDVMATGPVYPSNYFASSKVKPIPFNVKKALKILRKAGWKDTDKNGILDKKIDGKKYELSLTILEPNKEFEKYLTMFKEDAKQVGVNINIKLIEWSAFIKLLDERKFEGVRLGWGGGSVNWNPKQIWHSNSIKGGGSNFVSYSNKNVDKWIDDALEIFDMKERKKVLSKVYEQIAGDAPYTFLFSSGNVLYAHTKRMAKEKDTYEYGVGATTYWTVEK